jgi:hypothetical protein
MAYNKNLPDGDDDAAKLDDDCRENFESAEDAIGLEHYFITGGDQTGRHKFPTGNTAARNVLANVRDGMVYYNTDALAGYIVQQVRVGGAWIDISVIDSNIPRKNEQGAFTKPQFAVWEDLASPGGIVTIDFNTSARKRLTISSNVTISNPVNSVALSGSDVILDVLIGGLGGWTITWGSDYRAANLLRPVVSTVAGQLTRVYISGTGDFKFLVSTLPNYGAISA